MPKTEKLNNNNPMFAMQFRSEDGDTVLNIQVTAKNVGVVDGFPFNKNDKYCHYKQRITVKIINEDGTTNKCSFPYYTSAQDYWDRHSIMTETELRDAFSNMLRDAQSSEDGFENFCNEFGYEPLNENYTGKNRESFRIFRSCEKLLDLVNKLGIKDCYTEIGNVLVDMENGDYQPEKAKNE